MDASAFHVDSEVGRLRRVVVHRPGRELTALGRAWPEEHSGHGEPNLARAQREHDAFVDALAHRGVHVYLFEDLFADVLDDEWARLWVLHCSGLGTRLREQLAELPADRLAEVLVTGLTRGELASGAESDLGLAVAAPEDFVLPPLPSHVYTRDPSCWFFGGRTLNPVADAVRHRESVHMAAVYRFHPLFAGQTTRFLTGEEDFGTLEGGDVLVAGPGVLLVGLSERTSPNMVQLLALRLFAREAARAVVVVQLPGPWAMNHLDAVLGMVDTSTYLVHDRLPPLRSFTLRPGRPRTLEVEENDDLFVALARETGLPAARVLRAAASRPLAVEPGVVLSAERDVRGNATLREHGIEVIELPGGALGGPRCLACPLEREPSPEG
ncbi:arginine deiminase family protein [Crossiella equi]|uniref:arginine deiminase n=1 Tax=Crossiella equi TaxID=130796 RepID=UPI001302BA01|nr:arginine deiminase family protein [Crossiella equi]